MRREKEGEFGGYEEKRRERLEKRENNRGSKEGEARERGRIWGV